MSKTAKMDERALARQEFSRRSKKARRWQIIILPLAVALLISLSGFLWFALVPDLAQAGPPLTAALKAPSVTVRAGGNIIFSENMIGKMLAQGWDYPFRLLEGFLGEGDFSLAALEGPLADVGSPLPGKSALLRGPAAATESLVLGNISLLALASDHMMDYDAPALNQTIELLAGSAMGYMGAGENREAAAKPYTLSENGLRIAFLNYCENADIFYSYQYPRTMAAEENQAGVAHLQEEAVLADIAAARRNHDVVVISLHWSEDSSYLPAEARRALAHSLVEGGADVILGSGIPGLQGAEIYQNGLILYALGNLVSDQNDSRQSREAALAEIEFTALGWQRARLYPVLLNEQGQPALASGKDAADIRERIRSISSGYGGNFKVEGEALSISK